MSWDSILEQFPTLDRALKNFGGGTSDEILGLDVALLRLTLSCAIGWIIGQVYRHTFTGRRFTASLPDTHMLLCLGGALIWVVVQDSVVRAFGLAGTIGLIRYRTIVRDPKDTTLLLFSMVLGMACGLGQYPVAIVGTVVVIFTLLWMQFHHKRQRAIEAEKSRNLVDLLRDDDDDDDLPKPLKP